MPTRPEDDWSTADYLRITKGLLAKGPLALRYAKEAVLKALGMAPSGVFRLILDTGMPIEGAILFAGPRVDALPFEPAPEESVRERASPGRTPALL